MIKRGLFLIVLIGLCSFASASSVFSIKSDRIEHNVRFVKTIGHNSVEIAIDNESQIFYAEQKQVAHPYTPIIYKDLYFVLQDINHPASYSNESSAEFLIGLEVFLCKDNCEGSNIRNISINGKQNTIELIDITGPEAAKIKVDNNRIITLNSLRKAPYYVTSLDNYYYAPVNFSFAENEDEEESVKLLVFYKVKLDDKDDGKEIKENEAKEDKINSPITDGVDENVSGTEEIKDEIKDANQDKEKTGFFRKIWDWLKSLFS